MLHRSQSCPNRSPKDSRRRLRKLRKCAGPCINADLDVTYNIVARAAGNPDPRPAEIPLKPVFPNAFSDRSTNATYRGRAVGGRDRRRQESCRPGQSFDLRS